MTRLVKNVTVKNLKIIKYFLIKGGTTTDCTACFDDSKRLLESSSCVCTKPYFDSGKRNCELCHYTCKECKEKKDYCTSCKKNIFRTLKIGGKCSCDPHYYDDGDGEEELCKECDITCKECLDFDIFCTVCDETRDLDGSDCFCKIGYYDFEDPEE